LCAARDIVDATYGTIISFFFVKSRKYFGLLIMILIKILQASKYISIADE